MQAIRKNSQSAELSLLVILAMTLAALELVSARLAYETVGAVASALYGLAVGLNVPLFLIAFRSRVFATAGIVLLALALVPYQFTLADRLWRVQTEATHIVAFAYEAKISNGAFPANLADYPFSNPQSRPFIQEYRPDSTVGGFVLCYWVGTESTSHCYSPKDGWTYYPD